MESRRRFLTIFLAAAAPLGLMTHRLLAQARPVPLPKPGEKEEDNDMPKLGSKVVLEANKKDIKKRVERLFQLASELKAEVEKTDSVQVLSMAMVKKTEEIEKLAKEIRTRAIG